MPKENLKTSRQARIIRYAVIGGLVAVLASGPVFAAAVKEPDVSAADEILSSLDDPFDPSVRAPSLWDLFMKGLAKLKAERDALAPKPVPKSKPVAVPVVKVMQQDIPALPLIQVPAFPNLVITGIVYNAKVPQAIINGAVVKQGDVVQGVTILGIRKGGVDVALNEFERTYTFNNK